MISREKAELTSYQLMEFAKELTNELKDNKLVVSGAIVCEECKAAFVENLFPRERREVKFEEFINLKQDDMSVKEYFL